MFLNFNQVFFSKHILRSFLIQMDQKKSSKIFITFCIEKKCARNFSETKKRQVLRFRLKMYLVPVNSLSSKSIFFFNQYLVLFLSIFFRRENQTFVVNEDSFFIRAMLTSQACFAILDAYSGNIKSTKWVYQIYSDLRISSLKNCLHR